MKRSTMLGFALFLICLSINGFVSANFPTLSSEDITVDIYRRLDEIERQGQERLDEIERQGQERLDEIERQGQAQHAELAALREENVHLREANAKLAQRVQILEDFQRMTIDDVVKEQSEENEELDEGGTSSIDVQNGPPEGSKIDASKGGHIPVTKEQQGLLPAHGHNRIRQSDQGSTVAFFATRAGANAEHLGQHQAVLFDNIITNIGHGYRNTTGFFIAPVSGVYVFSTTILAYRETADFSFVVNGQSKSKLYAHSSDTYETTSQTAIFHLSKGDDVSIQNNQLDIFVNGNGFSTFSGFLLVPAVDADVIVG